MRGRAEPIRILFALADVSYVDNRVNHKDFFQLKPSELIKQKCEFLFQTPVNYVTALPFGQLPILKLDNGMVLSQSPTIERFLAKKFNLHGSDDFESAQIDEICDAIVDHELGTFCVT